MTETKLFPLMGREFPDFDQATLPVIPHYWQDVSWHNDVSPCFSATPTALAGTGVYVWIDYADSQIREFPETARFGAYLQDDAGERIMTVEGDDWSAILRGVDSMLCEWSAIREVNVSGSLQTFDELCAEFVAWAEVNGRPEGDAMDNLFDERNTAEQTRWLSDFVTRWDAMESCIDDMGALVRTAESRGLTGARVDALRAAIARLEGNR